MELVEVFTSPVDFKIVMIGSLSHSILIDDCELRIVSMGRQCLMR